MLFPLAFLFLLLATSALSSPLGPVIHSHPPFLALTSPTLKDTSCSRTPTSSNFDYFDCIYLLRFLRDRQYWFSEFLLWGDRRPSGPGKTPVEIDRRSCRLSLRAVSEEKIELFRLSDYMPRLLDIVRECLQPQAGNNVGTVPVGVGVSFAATLGGSLELSRLVNGKEELGGNVTIRW